MPQICASFNLMAKRNLFSKTVVIAAVIGSLVMTLVCTFAPMTIQLAVLGAYVSVVTGLVLDILGTENERVEQLAKIERQLGISFQIARDSNVFEEFEKIVENISKTLNIKNELFQELAVEQLRQIGKVTEAISQGYIEFKETETWRVTYERILRSTPVSHYYSVAYISSIDYWQDEPGKRSLQLNYRLQDEKGLNVERIAIIADSIWPVGNELPEEPIGQWLLDQHDHGIWTEIVRESQIIDEPDLHRDFGIYTDVAVGQQIIDKRARTSRFVLSFNSGEIAAAKQRWERLKLFSKSIRQILDRSH